MNEGRRVICTDFQLAFFYIMVFYNHSFMGKVISLGELSIDSWDLTQV